MRSALMIVVTFIFSSSLMSLAEESKLETLRIEDSRDSLFYDDASPREGDRAVILRGKKVTQTRLEALPELSTNNHRQAFTKVPGLLVSEVTNESFASFN